MSELYKKVSKRKAAYDLLRVVSMMLVIWFHMSTDLSSFGLSGALIRTHFRKGISIGGVGVSWFILLSGAAQCISYSKRQDLKKYYKSRILALFPAFYIAFFIAYLTDVVHRGYLGVGKNIIWNILGLDGYILLHGGSAINLVGEWFIGLIIILYAVFPLLYRMIKRYPKRTALVLVIYYILINRFYPANQPADASAFVRVVDFAAGIYLFLYLKKVKWWQGLAALVVFAYEIRFADYDLMPLPIQLLIIGISGYVLFCWMGDGLEYLITRYKNAAIIKVICYKIGELSYAVFLIHHTLIRVSLQGHVGMQYGSAEFIKWAVYVIILIFATAWLIKSMTDAVVMKLRH